MIFRLTSRPHQRVYSYAIRSGIWSVVILEKSWKIDFFEGGVAHFETYGFFVLWGAVKNDISALKNDEVHNYCEK